jgi:hypothetical protein
VIVEPLYANLGGVGELYQPLVDRLTELWKSFKPDELQVILRFVQGSNAAVSEVNAQLRSELNR